MTASSIIAMQIQSLLPLVLTTVNYRCKSIID